MKEWIVQLPGKDARWKHGAPGTLPRLDPGTAHARVRELLFHLRRPAVLRAARAMHEALTGQKMRGAFSPFESSSQREALTLEGLEGFRDWAQEMGPAHLFPGVGTDGITEEDLKECDFWKYRGRGFVQTTLWSLYLDRVDPVLKSAGLGTTEDLTSDELDDAVLTNQNVYYPLLAKEISSRRAALVKANGEEWKPFGYAIAGVNNHAYAALYESAGGGSQRCCSVGGELSLLRGDQRGCRGMLGSSESLPAWQRRARDERDRDSADGAAGRSRRPGGGERRNHSCALE